MTKHFPARSFRAAPYIRAEGADPNAILAQMQAAFEAFKADHKREIDAVRKDVLQTEKVDRINASIEEYGRELDRVNAQLAALKVGAGAAASVDPARAAHRSAFDTFFRKGAEAGLRDLEIKAQLTTQSDPDGGYLVPVEMETTINRVLGTVSTFRSVAQVLPIGTSTYTKEVSMGGATAGWVGEEDARTETATPTLRQLEFPVAEIYAEPYATQTVLDDARIDIEAWLAGEVSTTFAEMEGAAFIAGNGVKKPRGILSYDTVANASYAWGKIGFVVTGGASGFAASAPADAFVDLYHGLKQGYRGNARFIMSDATLAAVRKLKDGQGNYLWAPPTVAEAPSTILGKPVLTDDNMPSMSAGTFPVAFGDFARGYLIVDRIGIRVLRNPYKVNGKVAFYTTKRVGGGVQNFEAIKLLKVAAS
ncbi:phage major capsid protein [Zavarzinia aquatilis]|uniref:Phage major capsid protein n=1 Tax=Zavarzinia aquatilis TaxID=2211142 RepID=A0A317EH82_9PROT|nr:phage major capsid protein [Zavarzinia aquatilis]PWR24565.1 phage major capsid protein [Zavarzinia aquatilis]